MGITAKEVGNSTVMSRGLHFKLTNNESAKDQQNIIAMLISMFVAGYSAGRIIEALDADVPEV